LSVLLTAVANFVPNILKQKTQSNMTEFYANNKTINYEIYINTEKPPPPFCECKGVNETTFLNENKV
jgi:hypothetical protein